MRICAYIGSNQCLSKLDGPDGGLPAYNGPMKAVPFVGFLSILLAGGAVCAAEPPDGSGPQKGPQLLTAPPRVAAPGKPPRAADEDAATYDRCMKLSRDNPAAAKELADAWRARGGAHPAEHCFAVALIGLKQYRPAAARLEKLAEAMVSAPPSLRAGVLAQAGQAWLLAGDPGRAYADAGAALVLHPDDAEILLDRAEAAGSAGWYDKALADLDRVLKLEPSRVEALIYRASAYREQGQLDPALVDVEAALRQAPNSAPALLERGNIRGLKGDLDGARQDWQRVATLAPGSPAENAARANLRRLDQQSDATPAARPASR
jgi:tetratricopeptide (TPR) repeat protein